MKKNLIVAQSGGPTAAINASLAGVIDGAISSDLIDTVYGAKYGIQGVLNEDFINLSEVFADKEKLEHLKLTPAMALGSCRLKLPSLDKTELYDNIYEVFKKYNVGFFVYIGGNDSMDTTAKLSRYMKDNGIDIKVIGVPKTIDNDLLLTDHTPGFGSAAKFVATTLSEIVRDSAVYDLKAVTIIEIMGRHAGWLAASSCLLHIDGNEAPHLIYLPECEFSAEQFVSDVKSQLEKHNSVIVAVSEGVELDVELGERVTSATDGFGHTALSGVGKQLENLVKDKIGCKVRSVELNVLQRCSAHLSSKTDVDEAVLIGSAAVEAALSGETGKMMCFKRVSDTPYKVEVFSADASLVANGEKKFPIEWINKQGNNVTDEAIDYFLPLIEGECNTITKNGMPRHLILK